MNDGKQELPTPFHKVQEQELEALQHRRSRFVEQADTEGLCGLAISGGGIRVATFALGAIQAMANFKPEEANEDDLKSMAYSSRTLSDADASGQHTGILGAFDYLSTVSGGGFIGGWLTSWIQRSSKSGDDVSKAGKAPGLSKVSLELRHSVSHDKGDDNKKTEPFEVSYLRRFSNYLTPEVGLFSADTWTVGAIYLRNFLLNILILVAVALSVVVSVFIMVKGFRASFSSGELPQLQEYSLWIAALCSLGAWTFCRCLWNVGRAPRVMGGEKGFGARTTDGDTAMMITVILFCLTAIVAVPALAARWNFPSFLIPIVGKDETSPLGLALLVALLHGLPGLVCLIPNNATGAEKVPFMNRVWSTLCAVFIGAIAGAVGGLLLYLLLVAPGWSATTESDLFVVFGPPLVLFTITVGIAVEVGFLSRSSSNHEREWWARLAAWLLICSVTWMAITAISFYSGPAFQWMGARVQLALASGAFGISALAAKLGSSASTKHAGAGPFAGLIVRVGPALFLLAVAIGMSTFVREVILSDSPTITRTITQTGNPVMSAIPDNSKVESPSLKAQVRNRQKRDEDTAMWSVTETRTIDNRTSVKRDYVIYPKVFSSGVAETRGAVTDVTWIKLWSWFFVPLVIAFVLSARFDINMNSLNKAWANRIIRCYLGASHSGRKPHRSTGFDEGDDLPLIALRDSQRTGGAVREGREGIWAAIVYGLPMWRPKKTEVSVPDYDGPYHLVNGALNVYRSEDLSRQERRAESFVMSALYCGYTLASSLQDDNKATIGSYTPTDEYAGQLSLGSAVGISGAAASPNMGYHTMPSLAALMTIFNVRLGWWLPNPAKTHVPMLQSRGPRLGLRYITTELFSRTTADSNYVYISDGGHFENLATYELIRRRTRFIVVVDGEADGTYEFHGLASLVRKCRIDFGVDIQISGHTIEPVGVAKMRNPDPKSRVTLKDRLGQHNYALGLINYPKIEGQEVSHGLLLYVKASLIAGDALHVADLRQYAETHSTFPHESTADQFFSESQFESYRLLGYRIMTRVLLEVVSGVKPMEEEENAWSESSLQEQVAVKSDDTVDGEKGLVASKEPQSQKEVAEQKARLQKLMDEFKVHCVRFQEPRQEAGAEA